MELVTKEDVWAINRDVLEDAIRLRHDAVKLMQDYDKVIEGAMKSVELFHHNSLTVIHECDPTISISFVKRDGAVKMIAEINDGSKSPGVFFK